MKNEIKEILENMKNWSVDSNLYFEINDEKAKILYDYITYLQKENEALKKTIIEKWENAQKIKIKHPLQQRIDKAIEFVEKEPIDDEIEYTTRLLDILRGENNDSTR